jgi:SAM-dependent methyltransferase
MVLCLSQSLFSSAGVDRGTHLLLKSLAATWAHMPSGLRVLDLGSGCGVLGLALARDGARVLFRDRDALAVAFALHNCRANGVSPDGVEGALDLSGLDGRLFDLIVSNLPAKAGAPVHEAMLQGIRRHLDADGLAALVVVTPLADRIASCAIGAGLEARQVERTPSHVVLHARTSGPPCPPPPDPLAPYIRRSGAFVHAHTRYTMDAAWDLPEFDTLSHTTRLALDLLDDAGTIGRTEGPLLVWNPGQGHLPAYLSSRRPSTAAGPASGPSITAGGRDLLALRMSSRNGGGLVRDHVHTWDPGATGGPYGSVVVLPDDDPSARWEERLPVWASSAVAARGSLVVSSSSTFVGRLLQHCRGFSLDRSRKSAGFRAVLLRKP